MSGGGVEALRTQIARIADQRIAEHEDARREALAEPVARIRRLLDMATRDAGGRTTPLIQAVDNLVSLLEMPIDSLAPARDTDQGEASESTTEEIEDAG